MPTLPTIQLDIALKIQLLTAGAEIPVCSASIVANVASSLKHTEVTLEVI